MIGREWVVDARGADPRALADPDALAALVDTLIAELALKPVAAPLWHRFPAPGGITGLVLLAESHLALHTFPEHGSMSLNLFCCAPRARWDFERGLARHVGATEVTVRELERPYGALSPARHGTIASPSPRVPASPE